MEGPAPWPLADVGSHPQSPADRGQPKFGVRWWPAHRTPGDSRIRCWPANTPRRGQSCRYHWGTVPRLLRPRSTAQANNCCRRAAAARRLAGINPAVLSERRFAARCWLTARELVPVMSSDLYLGLSSSWLPDRIMVFHGVRPGTCDRPTARGARRGRRGTDPAEGSR